MLDVALIADPSDAVFSRMLLLELTAMPLHAACFSYEDAASLSAQDARLFLLSLDGTEKARSFLRAAKQQSLPLLCYGRTPSPDLPNLLLRPFPVALFREKVTMAMPSPGTVRRRVVSPARKKVCFQLCPETHSVVRGSVEVPLSNREYQLLAYLFENKGRSVSREELRKQVWNTDASTNSTDVYIRYLRQKLDERFKTRLIETVRGEGYRLREE